MISSHCGVALSVARVIHDPDLSRAGDDLPSKLKQLCREPLQIGHDARTDQIVARSQRSEEFCNTISPKADMLVVAD